MEPHDTDFVWDDYLEGTNSKAVPTDAFSHVEQSLVSSFEIGMKLEVPNPDEIGTYWVASVVMTCGPLLSLRFLGYGDDRSADFWFDVSTNEFHPLGWCNKNIKTLSPPEGVRNFCPNYLPLLESELEGELDNVPVLSDPTSGITPIDQIKAGMIVEVCDNENFQNIWPCTIIQNVGGRLLLRYYGLSTDKFDFWLFYLSERIHPIGWAIENDITYIPPSEDIKYTELLKDGHEDFYVKVEKENNDNPFPDHVFEGQLDIDDHCFEEGMKLVVLNTLTLTDICPATVTKVINSKFFVVEVDNLQKGIESKSYPPLCCNCNTETVFPCDWAAENGLTIKPPDGYVEVHEDGFCWKKYLQFCGAVPASKELFKRKSENPKFEARMKLEAVNPFCPSEIHAATVDKVVGPLIWISLDSVSNPVVNHVVSSNSCNIFHVGWCVTNSYPLQTPVLSKLMLKPTASCGIGESAPVKKKDAPLSRSWCPKIYFNHCCFTGPYLSKSNLAELPQAIGPGPIDLVMKDVLTRLINIAYKSSRVLRELQVKGRPDPKMFQQNIKAKYKGKSYRATVEFVKSSEQVTEFCRSVCRKLDCCPYLFGPNLVGKDCPENCHNLTKTKFGHGFLKKQKKPSYTSAATENSEVSEGRKRCGRKKKRIHWRLAQTNANANGNKAMDKEEKVDESNDDGSVQIIEKASSSHSSEDSAGSDGEKMPTRKKRKTSFTKSHMVTRGARLPNFWNERRWRHHAIAPTISYLKRGRPPSRLQPNTENTGLKKRGRPLGSTKKIHPPPAPIIHDVEDDDEDDDIDMDDDEISEENWLLHSNPLEWSVDDVAQYIKTTSCAPMMRVLKDQEIDGQALLLLTMDNVQEFLYLNFEPAKHLCALVEKLKCEYFKRFT